MFDLFFHCCSQYPTQYVCLSSLWFSFRTCFDFNENYFVLQESEKSTNKSLSQLFNKTNMKHKIVQFNSDRSHVVVSRYFRNCIYNWIFGWQSARELKADKHFEYLVHTVFAVRLLGYRFADVVSLFFYEIRFFFLRSSMRSCYGRRTLHICISILCFAFVSLLRCSVVVAVVVVRRCFNWLGRTIFVFSLSLSFAVSVYVVSLEVSRSFGIYSTITFLISARVSLDDRRWKWQFKWKNYFVFSRDAQRRQI